MAKIRGPSCREEGGVLGWEMTALVGSASGDRFKSFASLSVLSSHSIHGCVGLGMVLVTNEVKFGFGHLANSEDNQHRYLIIWDGILRKKRCSFGFCQITFFAIWFCFKLFTTAFGSLEQDCKRIILVLYYVVLLFVTASSR